MLSTTRNDDSSCSNNTSVKQEGELDLFMRLHAYAFNPSVNCPNPYVDQSKLTTPECHSAQESLIHPGFHGAFVNELDYSNKMPYYQTHSLLTTASPIPQAPHESYQANLFHDSYGASSIDYYDSRYDEKGKEKKKKAVKKTSSSYMDPEVDPNSVKRRVQVKIACVHCKKACKKCDNVRPCSRCNRLGLSDTCVDAPRKERKKGFKRGPYRRIDENGREVFDYEEGQEPVGLMSFEQPMHNSFYGSMFAHPH